MRHRILTCIMVAILALLLGGLFVGPVQAFTVTGATATERQWIAVDLAASGIDIAALDRAYAPIKIIIADEWPPFWDLAPGVEVISMDVLPAAIGLAYSDGTVVIMGALEWGPSSLALEVLNHELTHLEWFRRGAIYWAAWREYITEGVTITEVSWYTNAAEAYAEHGRRYWWTSDWWITAIPRTDLRVLTEAEFLGWVAEHSTTTTTTTIPTTTTTAPPPPPTTTTTLPRGDPWPDVAREDTELWAAAWWARDLGIALGYQDGTLGPYDSLTHRHTALIADRWIGSAPAGWVDDYAPVTRGELRDAYPGLVWDSERWADRLLRSQLIRLMYRGSL